MGPNPMTGVFMRREDTKTQRDSRQSREEGGRDGSDAATS